MQIQHATRLQQFDPARTPVIFVHGLQETGASWAPMIDSLRHDPAIREALSVLVLQLSEWLSLSLRRRALPPGSDGIERAFPNHKRIVLIGHSMGGMICRLMITDAGDKIWRDFFATPPAKTPLASDTRKLLEEALVLIIGRTFSG
jgi:Predicted acetyltransferases and hydrolases with the alpha/beta hydrolase fold